MNQSQSDEKPGRSSELGVYMISAAAEMAGVHPQTLRSYERKGLLVPQRSAGNTRRYSDADIKRLERIRELADIGLNSAGIRLILDMDAQIDDLMAQLDEARIELQRTRSALASEISALHSQYRRELVPFRRYLPARRRAT